MPPLILITNDDGILSPHLRALATALEPLADVLVVAPERQRSAASHAITLHKPLRLHEVAPGRFSLSGTPVDCVYVGVLKLAARAPALVISGINDGYNLGSDVFYSGTVAGAIEGALRGSVGIAISMAPRATDTAGVVRFARALVAKALAEPLAPGNVLNVNAPGGGETEVVVARARRRLLLAAARGRDHDREDDRARPHLPSSSPSRPSSSSGIRQSCSSAATSFAAAAHGATLAGSFAQSFITIATLSSTKVGSWFA